MHDVYEPGEDSYLLEKHVGSLVKPGYSVLDMGTGTGIQAMKAAKTAKKVLAADISPVALEAARKNAKGFSNIEFIQSDLFKNIRKEEFDLIIFNPPYLPDEGIEDRRLFTGKHGTDIALRFISQVQDYMKPECKVLLVGSSLARTEYITAGANAHLLDISVLGKEHIFFEDIIVFQLSKNPLLKRINESGISSVREFAHGKRGVVYIGDFKGAAVAIKTKKKESEAGNTIENETRFLKILNPEGIGPRLMFEGPGFFAYRFIDGVFVLDFFRGTGKALIIRVISDVLSQCMKLDTMGINKFEMSHPQKHILVENGVPVLIDFERARHTDNPKNITQFSDFLLSEEAMSIFSEKMIALDRERIISAMRDYRKGALDAGHAAAEILDSFK